MSVYNAKNVLTDIISCNGLFRFYLLPPYFFAALLAENVHEPSDTTDSTKPKRNTNPNYVLITACDSKSTNDI